jgi:SAM-dependent methyltransferase
MPAVAGGNSPDARRWARFFEILERVPRGGPGDSESTRRALAMMTGLPSHPAVLDLGCGPGGGSAELASLTGGHVTALDLHAPFVAQQARAASRMGMASRIDPVCADMRAAPFLPAAFDLVWSEGALYSIGFAQGLGVCLRLARPGGYLAVSEAVWTVPDPPDEVHRWWAAQYPDIASIAEKTAAVARAGFDIIGHFTLPRAAWREGYYEPIRKRLDESRLVWSVDDPGLAVLAEFDTEIQMFERWGHTYSYEFIVARRPTG